MPGFDRTGPAGAGPMTGGVRGRCNPAAAAASASYYGGAYGYARGLGLRRGFRGGFGAGRDFGRRYGRDYGLYAPVAAQRFPVEPANEAGALRAEAAYLKQSLAAINARLEELEKTATD